MKSKNCLICKKTFSYYPSRKRKTCSIECRDKYRSRVYRGKNAFNWKGGKINNDGYIMVIVRNHPHSALKCSTEYLLEHRFIMETELGRYLLTDEHVHHINGDKKDNRIENLILMTNSEHKKIHSSQRNDKGQFTQGRAIINA